MSDSPQGGHRKRFQDGRPVQHSSGFESRGPSYRSNNTSEDGGQGSSTPHKRPREYTATPGFANQDGIEFEIKMCALVFLRAVQSYSSFTMTSNDPWAGRFDDIVVSYRSPRNEQSILVQLKTSNKPLGFIPPEHRSLQYYFQSLKTLNTKYFKNCTYVFYTNANVDLKPSVVNVYSTAKQLLCTSWTHDDVFKVDLNDDICKDFRDDTGAKDFVNRLLIFRNQSGLEYLDELIKQELFKICNGFVPEYRTIQQAFVEKIKVWCRKRTKAALDENWEEWTVLKEQLFDQNTRLKQIKFCDETLYHIEKWVSDSESDIILFKSDSAEAQIACSKVYQTFIRRQCLQVLFTDLSEPQGSQDMLFSLWFEKEWDVLVITDVTNCCQKLRDNIANYKRNTEKRNKKKIVIVSSGDADKLGLSQVDEWGTDFIKSTFNQLDGDSQHRLRNLAVDFQGKEVILGKIMTDKVLEGGILQYVLTSPKIQIGTALPPSNEKYIPRTLSKIFVVNDGFWESDEMFYIGGVYHHSLERYMGESGNYAELSRRFNTIPRRELYEAIREFKCCEKILPEGPVHFLEEIDGSSCYWIHSHGSTDDIFKYIEWYPREEEDCKKIRDTNTRLVNEEDLVRNEFQTVIVADEPGSGKTALLLEVANEMKKLKPHRWIIHLDLNKHSHTLYEIKQLGNVTNENVLRLLSKAAHLDDSELGKQLLKYSVLGSGDISILFDAFDEIAPPYTDTVLAILKFIFREFKLTNLWIASRYNMRKTLEEELESHVFRIEPLSDEEQIEFMSKLWGNKAKAKKFHSAIIDELPFRVRGSPLHIKMMCEVFSDLDMSDNSSRISAFDVVKLYEKFIEKKFDIYFKEKCNSDPHLATTETNKKDARKLFMERHMICSLRVLGVDYFLDEPLWSYLKDTVKEVCETIQKGDERLGIIDGVDGVVNDRPHFIHRTYAEYFAAKWLLEHKKEGRRNTILVQVSFEHHLQFVNHLFCLQLDAELPAHLAVLKGDIDALKDLKQEDLKQTDDLGRTPLHLAAMMKGQKAFNMVSALLNCDLDVEDLDRQDNLLRYTPLEYAYRQENEDVVRILCERGALLPDSTDTSDFSDSSDSQSGSSD